MSGSRPWERRMWMDSLQAGPLQLYGMIFEFGDARRGRPLPMFPNASAVHLFFQAEDRIRDWSVTGVQTCALPIFGCVAAVIVGRRVQLRANQRTVLIEHGLRARTPPGALPLSQHLRSLYERDDVMDDFFVAGMYLSGLDPHILF